MSKGRGSFMSKKDDYSSKQIQFEMVFSEENGEQKRIVISDPEKFKIVNINKAKAYADKMVKENDRIKDDRGHFVIGKNEPIKQLERAGLTISDRSYFMQLVLYARFDGKPLSKDGSPLTVNQIADIWGITRIAAVRKLKKFVTIGIILSEPNPEDKRTLLYFLNEKYFWMGKVQGENRFVKIFLKKLNEIIERIKFQEEVDKKKGGDPSHSVDVIGLLNAVIPYFHYQTYYLCSNPDDDILKPGEKVIDSLERDQKQIKHLTRAEISRILGYKRADNRTRDRYMDKLQSAGAVMVTKVKNKRRYLIHPDLMFRMDGSGLDDYTRYIRAQFNQHN